MDKKKEIKSLEELQNGVSYIHRMSAKSKLAVLLVYIISVTSINNYDVSGLFFMILFPVTIYQFALIPVRLCFQKLKYIFFLLLVVGIFNPIFDRNIVLFIYDIPITGGTLSMMSLFMKGAFCLMATFLLMATTRVEDICEALMSIHIPRNFVSLIYMTYRYLFVLVDEVSDMVTNYHLRAPRQKGIDIRVAGPFLGQLLLRTLDKGDRIYEYMILRGYKGEFYHFGNRIFTKNSWILASITIALIVVCRICICLY